MDLLRPIYYGVNVKPTEDRVLARVGRSRAVDPQRILGLKFIE
jgi:hypothetical protein